jgi:hypothetical protein
VDKALALQCAKEADLTGALVFAVGKGPVQGIVRFGELSGAGEHKYDATALTAAPLAAFPYYGARYIAAALNNRQSVPHHVGMAVSEKNRDGMFSTYVLQINPEKTPQTKVAMNDFAKQNVTVKIIMPEYGAAKKVAQRWRDADFDQNGKDKTNRQYDLMRLLGQGSEKDRGQSKTICSENVWFRTQDYFQDDLKRTPNVDVSSVYKGVVLDNRITPWDFYKPRDQWDRDMVEDYKNNNPAEYERIRKQVYEN